MSPESPTAPSREELIALVAALMAENAALKARIAELERRLGLNSSNSGKPPSSDGLKKPVRVRSLREKSKRRSGGQTGHKGETLWQAAEPNNVENHFPKACAECVAVDPSSIESICAGFERLIFDDAKYNILLEEIAVRPLRSWADYANRLLDHLYSKSIDYDAELADAAADSIRIGADKFTCHRAYARNGVDTLRYGNNILYVRSVHGRVDEPHLFHGPYITLEPGDYSVFIDGKLDGSMNIELLKDQGNKFCEFQADDFNRPFQVHLPEKIKNFEIRGVLTKNTERLKLSCVVMTRENPSLQAPGGEGQPKEFLASKVPV